MIIRLIKKNRNLRLLLKETNDVSFMNDVNDMNDKILKYGDSNDVYYSKIKKHYLKIKNAFFGKKCTDLSYLEAKKIAYNYHLYLLRDYYNKISERLFFEKLSN